VSECQPNGGDWYIFHGKDDPSGSLFNVFRSDNDHPRKPATILKDVGSVGLSMVYWTIGWMLSQSTLSVYLELASYFPSRSGSDVVYLEQAYPKPQYFFPTIFAIKHVVFSFGSSNAIVFAEYMFGLAGASYTDWQLKAVAVAGYTLALIGLWAYSSGDSKRYELKFQIEQLLARAPSGP
jgi:Amino acid permease